MDPDAESLRRRVRRAAWWILPLVCAAVLGAAHIPAPLTGDQALYLVAARSLLAGQTLYADFWDIKHPGVHAFYALAASCFGADEGGIRAFELLYLLAFGALLQGVLRSRLEHPSLAALAPIATVGAYYLAIDHWHLTQVEILPGPALFVTAWLASPRPDGARPTAARAVLAGASGAIATLFVGHMTPVPIAMLGLGAIAARSPAVLLRGLEGFGLIVALVVVWFWCLGAAEHLLDVFVLYPADAAATIPANERGLARLHGPARWFLAGFGPWLIPAAGVALRPARAWREPLVVQHVAWGVVALVVMCLETRSAWPFHFLFYVVPVGVLAIYGLDTALTQAARRRPSGAARAPLWASLTVGAAVAVGLPHWLDRLEPVLAHVQSHGLADFDDYRCAVASDYAIADEETSFLRAPDARPGPIYAFGNPLMILRSGRRQGLARNGWGWEVYLPRHWALLPSELRERRPAYVWVDRWYERLIAERSPQTQATLEREYVVVSADGHGVWYQAR